MRRRRKKRPRQHFILGFEYSFAGRLLVRLVGPKERSCFKLRILLISVMPRGRVSLARTPLGGLSCCVESLSVPSGFPSSLFARSSSSFPMAFSMDSSKPGAWLQKHPAEALRTEMLLHQNSADIDQHFWTAACCHIGAWHLAPTFPFQGIMLRHEEYIRAGSVGFELRTTTDTTKILEVPPRCL